MAKAWHFSSTAFPHVFRSTRSAIPSGMTERVWPEQSVQHEKTARCAKGLLKVFKSAFKSALKVLLKAVKSPLKVL